MARHPVPQATSTKVLSRRILVNIKRDITDVIPRVIWQHELPVLQELFTDVKQIDAATLDEGYTAKPSQDMLIYNKSMETATRPSTALGVGHVFIGSPQAEYDRLVVAYGKHPTENIHLVDKIYGRFQTGQFERLLGQPELADLPEAQLRGLVLDYGYAPEPHKDAGPDEKNAAWAQRKALATMDHAGLVKIAEEVGVQIGG
jgi:hypothetical protein